MAEGLRGPGAPEPTAGVDGLFRTLGEAGAASGRSLARGEAGLALPGELLAGEAGEALLGRSPRGLLGLALGAGGMSPAQKVVAALEGGEDANMFL